jgi:hypothetical protein
MPEALDDLAGDDAESLQLSMSLQLLLLSAEPRPRATVFVSSIMRHNTWERLLFWFIFVSP